MKRTELFEVIAKNTQTSEEARYIVSERWEITSIEKRNPDCKISSKKIQ